MPRLLVCFVLLAYAAPARATDDLLTAPAPAPWQPSWRFYSALVLGGAGSAALGLAWYFNRELEQTQERADAIVTQAYAAGLSSSEYQRLATELESANEDGLAYERATAVSLAVGAALSAAAGAILLTGPSHRTVPEPPAEPEIFRLHLVPGGLLAETTF